MFSIQNGGAQVFHLLGYRWNLPVWVPTLAGVGFASVLLVIAAGFSGLGSRLREIGYGHEIDRHRQTVDELRAENARLRGELMAIRERVPAPDLEAAEPAALEAAEPADPGAAGPAADPGAAEPAGA